jgi:hypothetical protein
VPVPVPVPVPIVAKLTLAAELVVPNVVQVWPAVWSLILGLRHTDGQTWCPHKAFCLLHEQHINAVS